MCIIIHKPEGIRLPLSTILRAYQRNDDGWGLIARSNDRLIVRRDFGRDADLSLIDTYAELEAHELTIHCRIGTSGDLSIINTHPFNVTGDMWLFHNGIIDISRSDKQYCDTYHVALSFKDVLEAPGVDATATIRNAAYAEKMAEYAKGSKLVFVDERGVVIVNEELGHWADGCWFSNESAQKDYKSPYAWSASGTGTYAYGSDRLHHWEREDENEREWLEADLAQCDDERDNERTLDDGRLLPRCYRVETVEDEDALYVDALAFIDDCKKLEVDEISQRCFEEPELAAESISVLLQERLMAATPNR